MKKVHLLCKMKSFARQKEVSVLELMRSEHIPEKHIGADSASETVTNVIDALSYQRRIEKRNMIISIIAVAAFIMLVFLIDSMTWLGFLMVFLPVFFLLMGILLLLISWKRHRKKQTYASTLIWGILTIMYPFAVMAFLCVGFLLGLGPIPN